MTREEAHQLVDRIYDLDGASPVSLGGHIVEDSVEDVAEEQPERVLPKNQKVVRTKSSGDRVFYINEEKGTRQWVTNPDILTGLGFEMGDVQDLEDSDMMKYQMGPALYRVPEKAPNADA